MWNEIEEKNKALDKAIKELAKNGYDLALKEKNYKIALNKKVLELRANDMPVTLINLVIYGCDEVKDLRFQRDMAQVKYNTNQECINTIKLQLRILENQISREWGVNK